jgi:hypothetical protein
MKQTMKRLLSLHLAAVLLLLMAGAVDAAAQSRQQFSVASFGIDQFDLTAQNEQYKKIDGSGSLYAIIKVSSTNPDDDLREYRFNFGNMNHEVTEHDGKLWVYVQRNAKYVTISRPGYATIERYDLQTTIEAGRTYTMQLSVTAAPLYMQMVQFNVEPVTAKAVVMVKSSRANAKEELFGNIDVTGGVAKALPLGTYTYRVMAENYHSSEGRFTLKDKSKTHTEKIALRPNFSEVILQVNADADIYVNGEKKGRRNWKGILQAGSYQVECQQAKHRNSSQMITVEENDNRTFDLTPPTPITGTLAITSRPLGANITIDGKDYGMTPQSIDGLMIGHHTVVLRKQNYKEESTSVEIRENETTAHSVTLSDMAMMTITSQPTGATLYLDNKEIGTTPYKAEMASSDYQLTLRKKGYRDFNRRVHLDSSHPEVSFPLARQLVHPSCFYLQAGTQVGSLTAIEGTVGLFIHNINIEASYQHSLAKGETIWWNYKGDDDSNNLSQEVTYQPSAAAVRLGYGFIFGTSVRLTPQVGGRLLFCPSEKGFNAVSGLVGVRAEYALSPSFCLYAAPELSFAVSKSDDFNRTSAVSSKVKGWGSGFNLRIGASVIF